MNMIFKYDFGILSPGIHTTIVDNEINYIMDFQEQYGQLVMWANVKGHMNPKQVSIDVRWTGEPASDWQYVKTIQGSDFLVYHIYVKPDVCPVA